MRGKTRNERTRVWASLLGAGLVLAGCGGAEPPASLTAGNSQAAAAAGSQPGSGSSVGTLVQDSLRQAEADRASLVAKEGAVTGYNVKLAAPSMAERFADEEGRVTALSARSGEGASNAAGEALRVKRLAYAQALETEQAELGYRIQALGGRVTVQNRNAINLLTVEATAEQAVAIAALPGVEAVFPVRMLKKLGMGSLPQLSPGTNAFISGTCNFDRTNPSVQNELRRGSSKAELLAYHDVQAAHAANIKGQGVHVAVLDDGIDYTHEVMGGPGTAAMLNRAMVYAFAPDASRLGSAMFPYPGSKIIGGYDFFKRDLSPFPEFVRRGTLDIFGDPAPCDRVDSHGTHVLDILQTVAPEARFYAFKVCGSRDCPDSAIIAALNASLDPDRSGVSRRVDVVNMSLGGPAGLLGNNLLVEAANNIAKSGVLVVMAAGNDGPVAHAISSPAVAPKGTAVAEVQGPARKLFNGDPANLSIMEFSSSSGPGTDGMTVKPEVGAIGKVISALAGTGNDQFNFSGTSGASPVVAGVYALLRQQFPSLTTAQLRARMVNTSRPGAVWGWRSQEDLVVVKTNGPLSSIGDWLAPAHTVIRATAAAEASGTNSLSPFRVTAQTPVPAMRLGGGEVRANAALKSGALFYAVDDSRDARVPGDLADSYPASANFGRVSVTRLGALPAKTLWVENFGPTARTFAVTATFRDPAKQASGAVAVSFSATSVLVPAGGRVALTMTLRVDPGKLAAPNQFKSLTGITGADASYNALYRRYSSECTPSNAACMMLDVFDGKVELTDATETLRLPWQVMPLRGSEMTATATTNATTGQTAIQFTNPSSAAAGAAEVYDLLGTHLPNNTRVSQGRAHILAWGARELVYDVNSVELRLGYVNSPARRRAIQVVYVLDRNSLFTTSAHAAVGSRSAFSWGFRKPTFKLGVDVDGDGVCGNNAVKEFRLQTATETDASYTAAKAAFNLSKTSLNTTAQASDYIVQFEAIPVPSPGKFDTPEGVDKIDLQPMGSVNWLKRTSQVYRGKHLEEWAADGNAPTLVRAGERNIAGLSVDYRSGLVVSFSITIDDSPAWYTNLTGVGAVAKPGAPAANNGAAYGAGPGEVNVIEGMRLNPNQTRLTLCPMIGDPDLGRDEVYPSKSFALGAPRFQVAGVTTSNGLVSVSAGAPALSRDVTVNAGQHPALGVLLRSWNDGKEVSLIRLP